MGLLERGQAALVKRMKRAGGRTITYTRGATSYQFVAWPGQQLFRREATPSNAATVARSDTDYLFATADAVAAGVPLPPRRGDTITDPQALDDAGATRVFELGTPTGEAHWRFSDGAGGTVIRVHCKRAGA